MANLKALKGGRGIAVRHFQVCHATDCGDWLCSFYGRLGAGIELGDDYRASLDDGASHLVRPIERRAAEGRLGEQFLALVWENEPRLQAAADRQASAPAGGPGKARRKR